ncbi:DUF6193 family natural product biosynthesis protein [Streptomyces sp. NPDC004284]|uniref:DUF6193 family natural product biosynthesis protein n=1 Tax=Streptomyces sp. NPDC004284 TaxID=3364695 RepID=UPI0036A3F729
MAELHAEAPFLENSALPRPTNAGPSMPWRRNGAYLEPDSYEDLEMTRAAHAEPRLRAPFPFISHGTLMFSRCTGWSFSRDAPAIRPLANDRYTVLHRGEELSKSLSYTPQEAATLVVSRLQETWGPVAAGTEHDLRDRESR